VKSTKSSSTTEAEGKTKGFSILAHTNTSFVILVFVSLGSSEMISGLS